MPDSHISDEQLDAYALGTLPDAEGLEEHLLVCESCQERLRQADEFARLFREAATQPDARPVRRWWRTPRMAAGLAAAAMAASAVFVVAQRPNPSVAPAIVSLQSLRGPEAPSQIPAGRPAILLFDVAAGSARQVLIVDAAGNTVRTARAEIKDGRVSASIDRLPKGSYWVRLYGEDEREPIAEYGLLAR